MAAHHYLTEEDPNLVAQNYAVADYLLQQARTFVTPQTNIVAMPLTDSQTPDISIKLAKIIPEQIGTRFIQLGYDVDLNNVATEVQPSYTQNEPLQSSSPHEADVLITGNYIRKNNNEIDVKLRMVEVKTDRVIASFDYAVHISRGIQSLSEQKPKIIRMTPAGE